MPFRRNVEIGRVALVNFGENYGKLVVIVDVISQAKALVDAPGMIRQICLFKRLTLTDLKVEITRSPSKNDLVKAIAAAEILKKWSASRWGQKLVARQEKATLTDFERYKLMVCKVKRSAAVRRVVKGKAMPAKPKGDITKGVNVATNFKIVAANTVHAEAAGFFAAK